MIREAAVRVDSGQLHLADGRALPFRHLVHATGLKPNPVAARLGLPVEADGAIRVSPELQVPGHPGDFGAGDAIRIQGTAFPPAGVYAVRQAPVLADNLLAYITGRPLRTFSLDRPVLLILALGDGTALATFGPLAVRGRWAQRWKDRLDGEWMGRYGD